MRTILNNIPDWGLFLMVVGTVTILSVVGFILVRRYLASWRTDAGSGVVAAVSALVMTLFAFVLAFNVVSLDQSDQGASANVAAEANSLAEISHDASVFPPAEQHRIQLAIARYIDEVVHHEFPALRVGKQDPVAADRLENIFQALQHYSPKTQSEITYYDSAVSEMNDVITDRRSRLDQADSSLPAAFLYLLLLTALLSIGTTYFFKADAEGLEVALVACVAIVVGAGLLTALILQYPFSGTIGVSSDPYQAGSLGQLLTQYLH